MKKVLGLSLLIIAILRVFASLRLGLTVDEAHYVIYGQKLALSYFDHPPLIGWTQALFQILPLHENLQARLPAMLLSLLTSYLLFRHLRKSQFSESASLLAVLAVNLTPLFNSLSLALLPDTWLMPLSLLVIMQTQKVLESSRAQDWLLMGLYLGLAGLSKYTAILLVIALVILFLIKKQWQVLLKPPFWLGVAVALIIVSPVLIWNLQYDFISFKYQTDHVSTPDTNQIKTLLSSWGVQAASWGLFPFLIALGVHITWLVKKTIQSELAITLVYLNVFLVFFIYVSYNEVLLPHWMLIYFSLMIPLAVAWLYDKFQASQTLMISFTFSGVLSLALLTESAFGLFPIQHTSSLYRDVMGWKELMAEGQAKLAQISADQKGIAVMNWTLGSRALYYSYGKTPVFVLDQRFDQFDIWQPESALGNDLIILIEAHKKEEHLAQIKCQSLQQVGEKITTIKDVPVHHFLYYHCAHLLQIKQ